MISLDRSCCHPSTRAASVLLIVALLLAGCQKQAPTVYPGAANAFDSAAYDALVTIQAGIEQAKVNVPPAQKALLNKIIADYNTAQHAYQAYHAAALLGKATADAQANLQAQINALNSGLASLK